MKVSDIKHDVRVILGENEDIVPFLAVEDFEEPGSLATERDILTEAMILTAVNDVHSVAPREMLADVLYKVTTHTDVDKYGGFSTIDLPNDFLRFIMCEDESWDIPVVETTDVGSEEYMQLRSRFEGIRASKERPAVVLKEKDKTLYAEAYPTVTSPSLFYVKRQDLVLLDNIEIAKAVYKAVIYLIASLYYTSIKEDNMARVMENQCKGFLGITDR